MTLQVLMLVAFMLCDVNKGKCQNSKISFNNQERQDKKNTICMLSDDSIYWFFRGTLRSCIYIHIWWFLTMLRSVDNLEILLITNLH